MSKDPEILLLQEQIGPLWGESGCTVRARLKISQYPVSGCGSQLGKERIEQKCRFRVVFSLENPPCFQQFAVQELPEPDVVLVPNSTQQVCHSLERHPTPVNLLFQAIQFCAMRASSSLLDLNFYFIDCLLIPGSWWVSIPAPPSWSHQSEKPSFFTSFMSPFSLPIRPPWGEDVPIRMLHGNKPWFSTDVLWIFCFAFYSFPNKSFQVLDGEVIRNTTSEMACCILFGIPFVRHQTFCQILGMDLMPILSVNTRYPLAAKIRSHLTAVNACVQQLWSQKVWPQGCATVWYQQTSTAQSCPCTRTKSVQVWGSHLTYGQILGLVHWKIIKWILPSGSYTEGCLKSKRITD